MTSIREFFLRLNDKKNNMFKTILHFVDPSNCHVFRFDYATGALVKLRLRLNPSPLTPTGPPLSPG